jgi:nucleotide-binding universal stress UspA family protein
MTMRILVPDIDAVNSLPAVRCLVRQFVGGERFEVHLLYVRGAIDPAAADQALLPVRALLDRFHVPYSVHLAAGDPVRTIRNVARLLEADRIMMGTARLWSPARLVEDAVIEELLETAAIPVSLVSRKSTAAPLFSAD